MTSSEKDKNALWRYSYSHAKTKATTGYYSCVPEEDLDFSDNVRRLAERPLDSFLHQKLLRELGEMSGKVWQELAACCISKKENPNFPVLSENIIGVLASLLLECASLLESCAQCLNTELPALKAMAENWEDFTPLFLLSAKQIEDKNNKFYGQAIEELWTLSQEWAEKKDVCEQDDDLQRYINALKKQKGLLQNVYNSFQRSDITSEIIPPKELARLAQERLMDADLLYGQEMRHEASLSPIALLRQWRLNVNIKHGRHHHQVTGLATAYGRGLSLAQTRVSCLMEIVERASAHISVIAASDEKIGYIESLVRPLYLLRDTARNLREKGERIFCPDKRVDQHWEKVKLHWVQGLTASGEKVLVPAQAVFLFLNLDEIEFFDRIASTGLASGSEEAGAKLAALTEVLERDANSTSLYDYRQCFIPQSRDEKIQGLLEDYRAKRIYLYMQDISAETGFPVYRSIVRDGTGKPFFATGAGLDGKKAALSAITETPWPYSWGSPFPSSRLSKPPDRNLPMRYLEDLPNFSLGCARNDLALLEKLLAMQGHDVAYVDLTRKELGFPVVRAFISGMETSYDYGKFSPPGIRFWAKYYLAQKKR